MPAVNDLNRAFWTGGKDGKLMVQRCDACGFWVNPPVASCPKCEGSLTAQPTSGRGTVFTFTVNHQIYNPETPVPYVVALVELDDQEGLRVYTNLIEVQPDEVRIGMPVEVRFENHGEIFVPVFAPA